LAAVLLGFTLLLASLSASAARGGGYTLAVHPYLPVTEIHRRFDPLADHLAKALGRPVKVRIGYNYDAHLRAIGRDQVDLAFIGPALYVSLTEKYGRKPLLAAFEVAGEAQLHGVIAVRTADTAVKLQDIKGRYMAFGDVDSTMSHLVPRQMLQEAGIKLKDFAGYRFVGSHNNVALAVLAGDFDAGAMKQEVFDAYAGKGLRALAISPGVPDHLFVTRSNLPQADIERLRKALFSLHDNEQGRQVLAGLHKGLTRLIPVHDADYAGLRATLRKLEPLPRDSK